MDVTEDLRGLRHILGATIACVKFAVAVLGTGEGPHRHGARAGSSNLGFDVRKAHSTLLDKVRIICWTTAGLTFLTPQTSELSQNNARTFPTEIFFNF